jgi:hypothetical protein
VAVQRPRQLRPHLVPVPGQPGEDLPWLEAGGPGRRQGGGPGAPPEVHPPDEEEDGDRETPSGEDRAIVGKIMNLALLKLPGPNNL